ncbi:hypothetical protein GCM10010840_36360 [Deinococcus aerolatus]|uniref:P pilus assembly protein, chaperone PapD n=1 Tax=Deinococcus aerolatus TaxID=522487 RepID=A0ABQ2GGI9_9DEIO|nr:hypothetical protein [Deinococcus aerolatus]GGL95019.1 hypothetical protein GCM10010840_36360 [Deinococcus aerolatus]
MTKYLITLALLACASNALADLNVSGPRDLNLKPGEARSVDYLLTNTGDAPVRATVFFNDYIQGPDGSLSHVPARSLPQSLFRVASFPNRDYLIPAKSSVVVPLKVQVPAEALGGYWGVIGVDSEAAAASGAKNSVGIRVRYAMVTALTVDGRSKHALSIQNLVSGKDKAGKPTLNLTVANDGNTYERYDLKVVFQVPGGKPVEVTKPMVILPGVTIDLALDVPSTLPAGTYAVFAVATAATGERGEAVGSLTVPAATKP